MNKIITTSKAAFIQITSEMNDKIKQKAKSGKISDKEWGDEMSWVLNTEKSDN